MNSDINHTEEMERAWHEAYAAMSVVSQYHKDMGFDEFFRVVSKVNELWYSQEKEKYHD